MKQKPTLSRKKQKGQSLTEYLILVCLVAVSSIAAVKLLGHTAKVQLSNVTQALQGKKGNIKAKSVRESQYKERDFSDFMRGAANK